MRPGGRVLSPRPIISIECPGPLCFWYAEKRARPELSPFSIALRIVSFRGWTHFFVIAKCGFREAFPRPCRLETPFAVHRQRSRLPFLLSLIHISEPTR